MISYNDFVRLLTDVSEFDTLDDYIIECGSSVPLDDFDAVIHMLTLIWKMAHGGLTIRKIADTYETSVRQLSMELGVSYNTTSKWSMGERTAPDWALLMVAYATLSNLVLGE